MSEKNIRVQSSGLTGVSGQNARPRWEQQPAANVRRFNADSTGMAATTYAPRKKTVVRPVYPPGYQSLKPYDGLSPLTVYKTPPRQTSLLHAPLVSYAPSRPRKSGMVLPLLATLFILTAYWWLPLLASFALQFVP